LHTITERLCQGTACFVARNANPVRWEQADAQAPRIYCLGKCYAAPAAGYEETRPHMVVHSPRAIVLENPVDRPARTLRAYLDRGGYRALEKALALRGEEIVCEVERSELRGRGGAGFPTGAKWRAVYRQASEEKFIVANADEGDPGAYIDRFLVEDDPHRLIEAIAIAAHAVGARKGYVYLRKEYPYAEAILRQALNEVRNAGLLSALEIELFVGKGSYVCGEETALLRSLESRRPEPTHRPPYPTECGLFGKPTLVQNVETLASIPWIVLHGGEAYRALGISRSRGTKVVSLNSLFARPGLYEIEFGIPVRQIVEDLGGGLTTGALKGLLIGGPFAGIIPASLLDTPFGYEELRRIGAGVGHGGIVAFDEQTSICDLLRHVFAFAAFESCGKCTPCRLGSRRVLEMLTQDVSTTDSAELQEIVAALALTSLCGLGTGLAEFAESVFRYYNNELNACLA
jgi:NADH:ubiquinone oxidoreductase subunit F (NADH-binding)